MNTNAPKSATWWIAVIIGVLGIVGKFVHISVLEAYSWWLVCIGFIVLALATAIKGL
ncbi:MAG TPA: hypothetical protein PLH80_02235 [Spirochaetota bacterium]|nr:hypothetical protein [Spirochaetota bacterium]HOM87255.1 hypothetical protein [Spirochaetota bacterium]HOR92732.1 hypothetical protein [Spirochaetota bacterium]HOT18941.1 hypothetical protein [Spirochaetota bacterium]HPD03949.1 hypothetical protein [Spirochaetota bacterium]